MTGFLGPNGAGKSTTMRMILGLDNPTRGKALIVGEPYAHLAKPLTKVGSLLDANWIHPNRSARSHLRFMAASNKISGKRVDEVLEHRRAEQRRGQGRRKVLPRDEAATRPGRRAAG